MLAFSELAGLLFSLACLELVLASTELGVFHGLEFLNELDFRVDVCSKNLLRGAFFLGNYSANRVYDDSSTRPACPSFRYSNIEPNYVIY